MKRLIFILLLVPSILFARDGAFMWDANTEPDIAGYRIYYENVLLYDVAHPTVVLPIDAEDGHYTATAYDIYSNESEHTDSILVTAYYNAIKYEYNSSGQIIYKGEHITQDAADSNENWVITKYYYTNNVITGMRIRTTSWNNRGIGW